MIRLIDLPGGQLNATTLALSDALGDNGGDVALRLRTEPAFTERVARFMLEGAPEQLVRTEGVMTTDLARAIMGNDRVFGPDQVVKKIGAHIAPNDLAKANVVPYKLSTLIGAKSNCLLVYGVPTNIEQMKWSRLGLRWRYPKGDDSSFTTDTPVQGWYLICREPVTGPLTKGVNRYATLVEIYLALSLHKEVSSRHNFFLNKTAWCQQTKEGGEVLFGFGQAMIGRQYGEGSHDYWAVKGPDAEIVAKGHSNFVEVILPDDLPIKA